jgi:competence protein ComEC
VSGHAARLAALGGLAAGLGASPVAPPLRPSAGALGALAGAILWLLLATPGERAARFRRGAWLGAISLAAGAGGLLLGGARLAAIDAGALAAPEGTQVAVRGFVEAVPRRPGGEVRVRLATADGRLLLAAPEPVGELAVGHEVRARGTVREPAPWEAAYLARLGVARIVAARRIEPTGRRRGGLAYLADRLRERGEEALARGTPEPTSALLRGFVLGQDDRIDPRTVADFQRSGLAHLLAVSGQNVLLLALLAAPILALLGVPLRARLLCLLALIAIYVPVAGAGPSIQRAGVMGAAGVVATLAGRPPSRWYALLLAAAATLALNPRAAGDVGWQLSFAAVIGIALWAAPLRGLLGGGTGRRGARAILAEAAAVTIAATLATAPLMTHHFERLSLAALPANLLALPAVAPVMWLGMLSSAAGQIAWLPVEPLTWPAGLLAAYIAQIARWFAAPAWAELEVPALSPAATAALYAAIATGAWALARGGAPRRSLGPRRPRRRAVLVALLVAAALAGPALVLHGGRGERAPGLRVSVLDVGQGDAILLQPRAADPILVDAGPPGTDLVERLEELGVERLAAAVVTHAQSDHAGGLAGLLARLEVGSVAFGARAGRLARLARGAGARPVQLAEGSTLASGPLRLEVLWPPRARLDSPAAEDPNPLSVVARARWGDFELLLTGDGEAEAVPLDPGPVDVLKVAHHGSADAGLGRLLDRSAPALAVISVGEDNPYGHPAPQTMATLAEHEVPVLRTDSDGEVRIDVRGGGWAAEGADRIAP